MKQFDPWFWTSLEWVQNTLIIPHYWGNTSVRTLLSVLCVRSSLLSGCWKNKLLPVLCKIWGLFLLLLSGDFPLAFVVSLHECTVSIQAKTWTLLPVDLCSSFSLCATLTSVGLCLETLSHLLNSKQCFSAQGDHYFDWVPPPCSAVWQCSRLWYEVLTELTFFVSFLVGIIVLGGLLSKVWKMVQFSSHLS